MSDISSPRPATLSSSSSLINSVLLESTVSTCIFRFFTFQNICFSHAGLPPSVLLLLNSPPHPHSHSSLSRLDLWKRLCNFLEDYRDGFTHYQSKRGWVLESPPPAAAARDVLERRSKSPPETMGDVNAFRHVPRMLSNPSPSLAANLS